MEAAPVADQGRPKHEESEVYFQQTNEAANNTFTSHGTYGGAGNSLSYQRLRGNVQTVLATDQEDDWIFNLNIGNVMHLQPLSSEELNLHIDNSHELSRDAILEKIILLTVSYFCVGTELRFIAH